jgi:predicted DsbA family dithiol-disulfide isomerase/uncharacterized membrane protein
MRPGSTRHRVALVLALAGAALSALTLVVHARLAAHTGYTSFCNLGGVVNCDMVLASRFGTFLGLPVAGWGFAAFVAGTVLAIPGARGRPLGLADLLLLGVASGSLGFALVLLVLAVAVLRQLCLLCLALDVVIVAWVVTLAPLVARFDQGRPTHWWRRRGAAQGAIAAGLVLAVAGGTWAARGPGPASTLAEVRARDPEFLAWYTGLPVRARDGLITPGCHSEGPAEATVAIVTFSDFQCPFCAQAHFDLRDLLRARRDVRLVFRHFPLDADCNDQVRRSLHPGACLAACAAECAGQQGRFWEYADTLFTHHGDVDRQSLLGYAHEVGLDVGLFRPCLDDPATRARVGEDARIGARAGVTSTPTLFINGRAVEGALERAHYDYALIVEQHEHAARTARGAS